MRVLLTFASLLVLKAAAQNTNRWTGPACSVGGQDFVIYSNPHSGCLCERKGQAPAGYVECPGPPNGNAYGFPVCNPTPNNSTSTCAVQCYQDADFNAQKECHPINPAPGIPEKLVYRSDCEAPIDNLPSDSPLVIAIAGGGCSCDRKRLPGQEKGESCVGPPNSVVFCRTDDRNLKPGECDFRCTDPNMKKDGKSCVPISPGPGPGPGPGPTYPVVAGACPSHRPFTFAYTDNTCACFEFPEDGSPGDLCSGPSTGPGKGACRNTAAAASECIVQCDKGYKLDGSHCVPSGDIIVYGNICGRDPPGYYLTAFPGDGCRCEPTPSDGWCQPPTGGGRASCFTSADHSVVECRPSCPDTHKAVGNSCVAGCKPGEVEYKGQCVLETQVKLSPECSPGQFLNPTSNGCECGPGAAWNTCWPPRTPNTGRGKCTSKYDGSQAACGVDCDPTFQPNAPTNANDCVKI